MEKAIQPAEHSPGNANETIDQARDRIESELEDIRKRLNRPPTLLHRFLAGANFLLALLRGPIRSGILDPDAVSAANREFQRLFPPTLPEMTSLALEDPHDYNERVCEYEGACGAPRIPFDTESAFYRLIVRDPIRMCEEQFLFRTALENGHLKKDDFAAVDLGTGSGRLAFCLAELLSRLHIPFEIHGLDISSANIRDALSIKTEKGYDQMEFVQGDMTRTPFESGRFSLCNASSSAYLVPLYQRPFQLLEMVRLLRMGGEGILTGPNEHVSAWHYTLRMAASNLSTYLNPFNLAVAHKLGPIGLLIDRAARRRLDFRYPETEQVRASLELAGCTVTRVEYWPESGGVGLFTGITFRTSEETERRISTYCRYVEKANRIEPPPLTCAGATETPDRSAD